MVEQPSFGRRLKAMRLERGLSQAALAGSGMSTGYLSRLESGTRPPTPQVIAYLAERLGVSAADFEESQGRSTSLARALANAASAPADEAIAELADALKATPQEDHALRWQALLMLADFERRRSDHDAELRLLKDLVQLSGQVDQPELELRARTRLARCLRVLGRLEESMRYAAEALQIAEERHLSPADTGAALLAMVSASAEAGRLPEAQEYADRVCRLLPDLPGTMPVEALWAASTVRVRRGDGAAALDYLQQAINALDSGTDVVLWFRLRLAAASLSLQLTPPEVAHARKLLKEAEAAVDIIGIELHRLELLVVQAHLAFQEGQMAEVRELCDRLEGHDEQLSFRDRSRLQMLRNQLLIVEGHTDEGLRNLQELALNARKALNLDLAAEIWRTASEALTRLHETKHD
ncbi:helix-turn-helix domain-containing protein [Sphaerisporangium sp. NPDC051017]|uniref:helix-turn-helix domain-containing protein n=1 Tax=Sphaerisporangium sp. NPDC051017 TaxID=3154636 RepID=UPI00343B9BB2